MVGIGIREEGDKCEVAGKPIFVEIQGERDRCGERWVEGLLLAKKADERGVVKSVAGIFAGGDVGAKILFGYGNPQFELRGVGAGARGVVETQLEGAGVRAGCGEGNEEQSRLGMGGGPADLITGFVSAIANELSGAIDDHLRGIDAAIGESDGVLFLAVREIGGRKGVRPAESVPVVDMLFESENFDAIEGLIFAQFFEDGIGRRATGAAFGGEEFDDDRLLEGSGVAVGRGGRFRGPAEEQEKRGEDGGEECQSVPKGFGGHVGLQFEYTRRNGWEGCGENGDEAEKVRGGRGNRDLKVDK